MKTELHVFDFDISKKGLAKHFVKGNYYNNIFMKALTGQELLELFVDNDGAKVVFNPDDINKFENIENDTPLLTNGHYYIQHPKTPIRNGKILVIDAAKFNNYLAVEQGEEIFNYLTEKLSPKKLVIEIQNISSSDISGEIGIPPEAIKAVAKMDIDVPINIKEINKENNTLLFRMAHVDPKPVKQKYIWMNDADFSFVKNLGKHSSSEIDEYYKVTNEWVISEKLAVLASLSNSETTKTVFSVHVIAKMK